MRQIANQATMFVATVLLGGLLTATLVRFGPGFETDERDLDARLGASSLDAIHASRAEERDIPRFYLRYLAGLAHGDFGISRSLGVPVRQLLADRWGVTFRLVAQGVLAGWAIGLALAVAAVFYRGPAFQTFLNLLSGVALCLPAAVTALIFYLAGGPVFLVIALAIFPKVFRYGSGLLIDASTRPHVAAAKARGLSALRIFLWHILPLTAPQLLALAGVSLTIAFGAAIPVEVVCDLPGIGQLAWKAAIARDLPLILTLTLAIVVMTQLATALSDLAIHSATRRQA